MLSRLFRRQLSPQDQILHHGMVSCDPPDSLVRDMIGAAVPDVNDMDMVTQQQRGYQGGPHPLTVRIREASGKNQMVGFLGGGCQDSLRLTCPNRLFSRKHPAERIHSHRACNAARPGAAHSVTYDAHARAVLLNGKPKGILIVLSYCTFIRDTPRDEHRSHPFRNCSGGFSIVSSTA
jgi:hypothetical protein